MLTHAEADVMFAQAAGAANESRRELLRLQSPDALALALTNVACRICPAPTFRSVNDALGWLLAGAFQPIVGDIRCRPGRCPVATARSFFAAPELVESLKANKVLLLRVFSYYAQ